MAFPEDCATSWLHEAVQGKYFLHFHKTRAAQCGSYSSIYISTGHHPSYTVFQHPSYRCTTTAEQTFEPRGRPWFSHASTACLNLHTQEMSCIIAGPLQAMKEPETPRCFPHSVIGVTYSRRREVKGLRSRRLHEELTLVLVLQLGACLRCCSMLGLVCNLSLLFARNLLALATRSLESD